MKILKIMSMKSSISFDEALDMMNKDKYSTAMSKSVKLRESTYKVLMDMKINNDFNSLDETIVSCILFVAMNKDK